MFVFKDPSDILATNVSRDPAETVPTIPGTDPFEDGKLPWRAAATGVCHPTKALEEARGTGYLLSMPTSNKVRQLAESYAGLSVEERSEFLSLVAIGDGGELSGEWIAELRSRADDIDSGRVKLIDGEDFLRRLNAL